MKKYEVGQNVFYLAFRTDNGLVLPWQFSITVSAPHKFRILQGKIIGFPKAIGLEEYYPEGLVEIKTTCPEGRFCPIFYDDAKYEDRISATLEEAKATVKKYFDAWDDKNHFDGKGSAYTVGYPFVGITDEDGFKGAAKTYRYSTAEQACICYQTLDYLDKR